MPHQRSQLRSARLQPDRRWAARLRSATARLVACSALAFGVSSCTVHEHTVGLGPNSIGEESMRQYYLFWGLFRLNEVDPERMTDGATSYRIRTETALSDFLLFPLLFPLTVSTRTVTVSR